MHRLSPENRATVRDYLKRPAQGVLYLETYGVEGDFVNAIVVQPGAHPHLVSAPGVPRATRWHYINGFGLSGAELRRQIQAAIDDLIS